MWRMLTPACCLLILASCGYHELRHMPPPAPPGPISRADDFNTEEYARVHENEFLEVGVNPVSTFSIDVDAASYSNVRRFINDNEFPPKDAVRIEELINYFNYEYPDPCGEHPISITTEVSACPWQKSHRLLHIGLKGVPVSNDDLSPSNLVFLLDVSGSMDMPDKLPLLKSAFRMLVRQLRKQDQVAIVVYAGSSGLVLRSTPGNRKGKILEAIESLWAGGSTAGGSGIKLAYKVAKENFRNRGNNRIILATDGDFNVGVSSTSELVRLIERKRKYGIYLTVLGFGIGNLKDSRLEQLADKGNGHYAYVDNLLEAKKVLVNELGATLLTIANDVKVQVEFNPVHVKAYRLVGYENRLLRREDFNDDTKDAGDMGAGHTVTALYEIVPTGNDRSSGQVDPLRYQMIGLRPEALACPELATVKLRYKPPTDGASRLLAVPVIDTGTNLDETSDDFRFSAAVAEFGMLLRDSKFKGDAEYEDVIDQARNAKGEDPHGYRAEFIRLAEVCTLIER